MRDIRILLVEVNQPDVDLLEQHQALTTEGSYPITYVDFTQFFDVVKSILYKAKGAALIYRDTRLSRAQVCTRPDGLT